MLTITCQCGEVFHADEGHRGRAIRCGKCGRILGIGASPPTVGQANPVQRSKPEANRTVRARKSPRRWLAALLLVAMAVGTVVVISVYRGGNQREAVTSIPAPSAAAPVPESQGLAIPKAQPVRLRNGTNILAPIDTSGRGTLRIDNGTNYDAAVSLLDIERDIECRVVYVRARQMIKLKDIPPHQCKLFFALGKDWDGRIGEFKEDASFAVFEDLLQFRESRTDKGVQWANFTVTLHPVFGGNARTNSLSREEFFKLLHGVKPPQGM